MTEVEKKSGIYESNDGNDMIVDGKKYPITIPVANWIRDKKYQSGLNVTFEIKEQNGRMVVTKVYPTPSGKPATEPTKEELDRSREEYNATAAKMKTAGFGQPTPGPSPDTAHKEVPAARAPDELFTDAEVAVMKARADAAMVAKGKETEKVDGIAKICADTKARNEAMNNPPQPGQIVPVVPVEVVPAAKARPYSDVEILLIRNIAAKNCTEPEFKLLMYMASKYGLDPLVKQIWAVKRTDRDPALIFAGRDGFLALAHRSGHFDGMKSGVNYETNKEGKRVPVSAWCEIWRNDMTHSFQTEVPFSEYNTGYSVWKSHPSAMILKVAESVCLRKAFSIDGIYSPEEIDTERSA